MAKSANADLLDAIRERMRICKEELEVYKEKSQTYYNNFKEETEKREKVGLLIVHFLSLCLNCAISSMCVCLNLFAHLIRLIVMPVDLV